MAYGCAASLSGEVLEVQAASHSGRVLSTTKPNHGFGSSMKEVCTYAWTLTLPVSGTGRKTISLSRQSGGSVLLPCREFPWEHLGRRRCLLLVLFCAGLGTLGLEQVFEFRGSSGLNCRSSSSVKWSLNGKSGLVRLAAADEHMQFPA